MMALALTEMGFDSQSLWVKIFGTVGLGLVIYVPLAGLSFVALRRLGTMNGFRRKGAR